MFTSPTYPHTADEYEAMQEALAHEALLESPEHAAMMEAAADEACAHYIAQHEDEDRYLDTYWEDAAEYGMYEG